MPTHYLATTISDRTINSSIMFPQNVENKLYSISNNFYNSNIFKNINEIIFDNELSIYEIGVSAFENCQILPPSLNLSFNLKNVNIIILNIYQLMINERAFCNTNIEELNISINKNLSFDGVLLTFVIAGFSNESFINNKKLKTFCFEGSDLWTFLFVDKHSFKNCPIEDININNTEATVLMDESFLINTINNPINRVVYISSPITFLYSNIFSGNYNNFNLTITSEEVSIYSPNPLANILCDIKNFSLWIPFIKQEDINNLGLTEEQKNKLNIEN